MLIERDVLTHASLPLDMRCFSGTISSPGCANISLQCPGPVLRRNIGPWRMVLLKPAGYVNFCKSSSILFAVPPWSMVTTSVLSISPPTQSSISEPSMSRLIYTLSENGSPSMKSASYTCPLRPGTPMSSPKACRRPSSPSLGPVLMFVVLSILTMGECWNVIGLVGLPIKAPHLAYMYALTMPNQYHLVFPNSYLFKISNTSKL